MKKQRMIKKSISLLLVGAILLTSCTSTTMIKSTPKGANIFIDGQYVGKTPYTHSDNKISGSTTTVRLEKDGYEPLDTLFSRDEKADIGAIVGGFLILFPFLWVMKYNFLHSYELTPNLDKEQPIIKKQSQQNITKSKVERLKELKQLLDEKVITPEEFEKEKQKILEEDEK